MALNTTSVKFKLVEAASVDIANSIPAKAGQYIVCDTGEAFYDPSPEGASRVALSPDLSGYLKKSFATKVLTNIKMEALANGLFKCTVSTVNPSTNETSDAIYIQVKSSTGAIKADVTGDTVDLNLNYGEVSADNTTLPVNGASVATAIKDAQDNAVAATKTAVYVTVVGDGVSDTDGIAGVASDPKQGDIAICKHLISGTDNYSYTAYVYNVNAWQAMDGNYSAENVYFPEDLLTTSAIGNITLSGGQATIAAEGKNLLDTWQTIFVKETNTGLKLSNPTTQFSGASLKYVEVGSSASTTVTMSMKDDGEYRFGYTSQTGTDGTSVDSSTITNDKHTGVVIDATTPYSMNYKIGSKGTPTSVTATGANKNTFVVDSGIQTAKTNAYINGAMKYGAGKAPVSNLKKMYPSQAITAGSATVADTELFRWYVPIYWGFSAKGTDEFNNMTGAQLKSLWDSSDSSKGYNCASSGWGSNYAANCYSQAKPSKVTASGAWSNFFIAVPSSYNWTIPYLDGFKDDNGLQHTVNKGNKVTIAIGTASIEYQIWYIHYADNGTYKTTGVAIKWS